VATGETAGSQGQFTAAPAASVSRTGVIVHSVGDAPNTHLVWFGRNGRPQGALPLPEAPHVTPAFSPDGTRLAFSTRNSNRTSDIWILEIARGVSTRFTFDPSSNIYAVWSPDGTRIAFSSDRGGTRDIFVKSTSGAEPEKAILTGGLFKDACAWSPDGTLLVYRTHDPKTQYDLWRVSTSGEGEPTPYLASPYNEPAAAISPDGRWIAYLSDESGRLELYAQSFPEPGSKHRISTAGAAEGLLAWTRGGNEILYVGGDARSIMAAPIRASASLAIGTPVTLFDLPDGFKGATVTSDGERFLISAAIAREGISPLTVVLNWTQALSR
jgi:Tol biopolymer transport system component